MTKIIVRSNQSSVNPTAGGQRVGVEYNDAGNRAAANMYGTIGKAFNAGLDVLNKEQEQNEALRVAKATNEFNLELGKLKVDYMQKRQGSNSAGVINDFLKDANVLSERIYAKSGIRYKLGEQAFKRITDNTLATDGVQLYKFQEQETQKYKQNVFDQSADNLINGVIDGESLLENYPIMEGLYRSMFPDLPEEQYKQVETEMANRYAAILVNDAVNRDNYKLARDRLSYFRDKISPEVRTKLKAALYSEQEYVENSDAAKELVRRNITDPEEQNAFLVNFFKSKGTVPEGKYTFKDGVSFEGMQENAVQGIKGITGILNQYDIDDVYITSTRYDYSGHAPGSAHYEGVGADIASDKLAELDKSSRNIVADELERAYPGLKVLNEYDDPSDYATAGHFHLDFTNYKGESRLGASGLSARRMDRIKQMAETMMADNKRRIKAQNDLVFNNAVNTVYEMYQQGISYEDALKEIKSMVGLDFQTGNKLKTAANFFYESGGKSSGAKASSTTVDRVNDMLGNHVFRSREEYLNFSKVQGFNEDQIYEANKTYDKYLKGEGIFKYDWDDDIRRQVVGDIKDDSAQKAAWIGALPELKEWVVSESQKTGAVPTRYQVIEKGKDIITKRPVGYMKARGTWVDSDELVELSLADYKRSGIESVNQIGDDLYSVRLSNGTTEIMNAARLYMITR
ncbi:hypothetical protein [Phascolarctobacterium faecium]|jgi:hypothetical protein|uniref:hypothetical protein n=1 Tax=Phascolarctobacterium faecium TaxID=33025 RepID=UPI0020560E8A|nr:MAG TPA: hypothetical protein [Caudoviricetes sp.]